MRCRCVERARAVTEATRATRAWLLAWRDLGLFRAGVAEPKIGPSLGRDKPRVAGNLPAALAKPDGPLGRRALERWWTVAALVLLAAALLWVLQRALAELQARGVQVGFDILMGPAGFQVGEGWFVADPQRPLWQAFAAGLLNTLRVALPALFCTTVLGLLLGLGQLARQPLVRALCTAYVEVIRNVPLLVQVLMAYFALGYWLPDADQAWQLARGWYISQSGLSFPWPQWGAGNGWPQGFNWPEPGRFNISGGASLTPEYLALFAALTVYTAAYVAESVRGGILAVPSGQWQAAQALGLAPWHQLRDVVLPQALRAIVPSLGNQYLNLVKNASLAVAVGYPDLVSVTQTALNQTGRSLECISIMMAVYLLLSLLMAGLLGLYNTRSLRGLRSARGGA